MTTISVPLSAELLRGLEYLTSHGKAENKAQAMRKALELYIEQQEIEDILSARREPTLTGDLDSLLLAI